MKPKKNVIVLSVIVLLAGIFTSCSLFYNKDVYLDEFASFVEKTEEAAAEYTEHEWQLAETEYRKFTGELYQKVVSELTSEDQSFIGELKLRYEKARITGGIKKTIKSIKDGFEQVKGALEEAVKTEEPTN